MSFPVLFRDTPGLTILVMHDVEIGDAAPIKQHPYGLLLNKLSLIKQDVSYIEEAELLSEP